MRRGIGGRELIQPYYQDEFVTLYLGDMWQVMSEMPDRSVDAVITDPPYCSGSISEAGRTRSKGQGLRSETIRRLSWFTGDNMGTAGLAWLLRSMAVESCRVAKESASLLAFCDWRMISTLQPSIESSGLRFQNLVVWDKEQLGLGTGFRAQHELVMHFTYGSPEYYDKGISNVIRCKRVPRDDREHQTQKPKELIGKLIRVTCPVDGVVLDPFAGSGTTGIAAWIEKRRCILIERDVDYCELIVRRIKEETAMPLFD